MHRFRQRCRYPIHTTRLRNVMLCSILLVSHRQSVGPAWDTFQALRRTNVTLMHEENVDPKAGSDQRGHTLRTSIEQCMTTNHDQKRAGSTKGRRRRESRTSCSAHESSRERSGDRSEAAVSEWIKRITKMKNQCFQVIENGAGDGTRTRDVQLGKGDVI